MKTAATNKKVRELISMTKNGKLIPRPEFQRRLVWTHKDKNHFLDSVLRGYPFPEIYIADGEVNLESGEGTQLLVDGLQRVSTLIEYFEGSSALKLLTVSPYRDLTEDEKRAFLQYDVAVRDLGSLDREEVVEVFKRINATKYSLLDIEINNAVYAGALKQYADSLASDRFFMDRNIFTSRDYKRMGDLRYALTIIITLLQGYFNRDDAFGEVLERYNETFDKQDEINERIHKCFDFLEECNFPRDCRIWKKADLFTVLVEMDAALTSGRGLPQPSDFLTLVGGFFSRVEAGSFGNQDIAGIYAKASIQATNDKVNRLRRAEIISGTMANFDDEAILLNLESEGLVSAKIADAELF